MSTTFPSSTKWLKAADVNDLLDISGELSLQIKANLLKVEGAGQYIKDNKVQEGTTNLVAVMKCTTVMYVFP